MAEWVKDLGERTKEREIVSQDGDTAVVLANWYKDRGKESEVSGQVEVPIGTTVAGGVAIYGEDRFCELAAQMAIIKATNQARAQVADPEKAKAQASAAATKLKALADQLGLSLEDLLNQ